VTVIPVALKHPP